MRILFFAIVMLAAMAAARNVVLYSAQADLDGDGRREVVEVVSPSANPETQADKWVVIRRGPQVLYRTPHFTTRFHPEFNSPESRAGVVIKRTPGQRYPDVMVVFTAHSGDLLLLRYTGSRYQLMDTEP